MGRTIDEYWDIEKLPRAAKGICPKLLSASIPVNKGTKSFGSLTIQASMGLMQTMYLHVIFLCGIEH